MGNKRNSNLEYDTGLEILTLRGVFKKDRRTPKELLRDREEADYWDNLDLLLPKVERMAKQIHGRFFKEAYETAAPKEWTVLSLEEALEGQKRIGRADPHGALGLAAFYAGHVLWEAKNLREAAARGSTKRSAELAFHLGFQFKAMMTAHHGRDVLTGRKNRAGGAKGGEAIRKAAQIKWPGYQRAVNLIASKHTKWSHTKICKTIEAQGKRTALWKTIKRHTGHHPQNKNQGTRPAPVHAS